MSREYTFMLLGRFGIWQYKCICGVPSLCISRDMTIEWMLACRDLSQPRALFRKFFTSSEVFEVPDSFVNKESTKSCGSFEYVSNKWEPLNLLSFSLDCGRVGAVDVGVKLVLISVITSGIRTHMSFVLVY